MTTTSATAKKQSSKKAKLDVKDVKKLSHNALKEISKVIFGQEYVLKQSLACLLANGHLLLVGVPGLAKTKLVTELGTVLGLNTNRIQCTPDLMPTDILGSEVLEETKAGKKSFRFLEGPIFTQLLMADEINRASPRTQSALLEAMQEKKVTVAGKNYDLPAPFHVLATQNPIEQEGTYPLPEAQLDRFLMQINVTYPELDAEKQILIQTTGSKQDATSPVFDENSFIQAQEIIRDLPVGEKLVDQIITLLRLLRPETTTDEKLKSWLKWGPGPRAGQAFMTAIRSYALIDDREAPMLQDVIDLAKPVLRHRLGLGFEARGEGLSVDDVIDYACDKL